VSFFEFILIMSSVMYAMSMAPLLTGLARILQFDGDTNFFLPQALVAVFLILGVVLVWWTTWWFHEVRWTFATYFLVIIEPLVMFFSCSLIFPRRIEGHVVDLETHYYKIRKPLLISMLIWFVMVFTDDSLLGLEPMWHSRRYLHLFAVTVTVWALFDKRRYVQTIYGVALLLATLSMVVGWFWVPAN